MSRARGGTGAGGRRAHRTTGDRQPLQSSTSERRLRALIISQPTDYGVAVCVRQQARAALQAGHDVEVACPESGPLRKWLAEDGVPYVRIEMLRRPSLGDLRAVLAIRRLAQKKSYDVVSLHSSKAGATGRLAMATIRRQSRPKVIFTPHSWSWNVGGLLAPLYVALERRLASLADTIVAVSHQEAEEGRRVLRTETADIEVIPNGVDLARFGPEGDIADRPEDVSLIVCVGRLSVQKGQDLAIRAIAMMRNHEARLRLVGEESQQGEQRRLQELAESLGVADRIEWIGRVDDPSPHLRAADLVVAPSRWEGMSLVFLEALACGATLVVSDVAGSQVVSPAAVVVPAEDPSSLAKTLDDLLTDHDARARLGREALEHSRSFDMNQALLRNIEVWGANSASRSAPLGS